METKQTLDFFRGENGATFCSEAVCPVCRADFPYNVSMENAVRLRGAPGSRRAAAGEGADGPAGRGPASAAPSPCPKPSDVSVGPSPPGSVLPLVSWVDALRAPSSAPELIIFIRVRSTLPCETVLFSTPSTKRVITELKLSVINPPEDTVLWDGKRLSLEQKARQG